MINIYSTVKSKRVINKLLRAETETNKRLHDALCEIGSENVRHAKALMAEKKSGIVYNLKGRLHRASAPGEAPAIKSGRMQRNMYYKVSGHTELRFGSKVPHLRYTELGTKFMAPRPLLIMTAEDRQGIVYNTLKNYKINQFLSI